MAHELTQREDGSVEFAFTGDRSKIWHGLGNQVPDGASIEDWIRLSGLDWTIKESPAIFLAGEEVRPVPDKRVLFRSDNLNPLGIIGDNYQIVQPAEVLEFFRDLVANHDMKLSAAGSIFGGRRFWAIADVSEVVNVVDNDPIGSHLLLTTSADGTLATTAMFTSIRVVCNNALNVAVNRGSKKLVKVTHKSKFDATAVKIDLGLLSESWDTFMSSLKTLAARPMKDHEVLKFFEELEFDQEREKQTWKVEQTVNDLMRLYRSGDGADLATGTAWGALNAVTNLYTHGTKSKFAKNGASSRQFWNSYFGNAAEKKQTAMEMLLEAA